ncbi:hypothetical protein EX30DRAFT_257617 [Ascodesmis nigricans]|uniref:Uncharacterized protein n=1 Tax=Ascodesmis nigricans TaxID=341454 RepID=A0A4S2MMC2_9PEZI|nr:hypothetical protein EX30DRAFT_257617 [Ascodesmis nigricans]
MRVRCRGTRARARCGCVESPCRSIQRSRASRALLHPWCWSTLLGSRRRLLLQRAVKQERNVCMHPSAHKT